jgi:hypothetical protein
MIVLLHDMRAPAGHTRSRENRRIQFRRETEHGENRRGVEVNVRAKLLLALHRFLEFLANRNPMFFAKPLA